ncbi:MAG: hypothetical protein IPO92_00380 [Saprospiraceae bacterium]|nr:hypothetical protein [Saprospiraceae bacterium]
MKKFIILFVLSLCFVGISYDASAQVRKKKSTKTSKTSEKEKQKSEKVALIDKLNPEFLIGNVGFFNGFYVSTKAAVGYKLSNRFTVGVGGKLFYNQYGAPGPDPSLFDYGGLVYGRGKITNEIYIQAEYDFMHYEDRTINFNSNLKAANINYPAIGLGYISGMGKWRFGIQLLYITNTLAQDYQSSSVVEYWVGTSYNF